MNGEVPFNSEGPSTEASNGAAGQKKVISKLSSMYFREDLFHCLCVLFSSINVLNTAIIKATMCVEMFCNFVMYVRYHSDYQNNMVGYFVLFL